MQIELHQQLCFRQCKVLVHINYEKIAKVIKGSEKLFLKQIQKQNLKATAK
jgi:hypothetical protein